ncbi:MAG: hypothetical protein AAFR05_03610, partial [Bacteroidota bacterium]
MFYQTLLLFQEAETEEVSQSLIDIILQGGPIGIAIVSILLVLSVIAFYIFVERYLTINKAADIDESFMNNIRATGESVVWQSARAPAILPAATLA